MKEEDKKYNDYLDIIDRQIKEMQRNNEALERIARALEGLQESLPFQFDKDGRLKVNT